jgi:hypothetical protein
MIIGKIVMYDGFKDFELAEIQGEQIVEKTRYKFTEGDPIFVFAKVEKPSCVSKYGYIVASIETLESATIDSSLVEFRNENDKNSVPII